MNIVEIRKAVKAQYPNNTWAARVDKMPDQQVIAIYHKWTRRLEELPPDFKLPDFTTFTQLSMFNEEEKQ